MLLLRGDQQAEEDDGSPVSLLGAYVAQLLNHLSAVPGAQIGQSVDLAALLVGHGIPKLAAARSARFDYSPRAKAALTLKAAALRWHRHEPKLRLSRRGVLHQNFARVHGGVRRCDQRTRPGAVLCAESSANAGIDPAPFQRW